MPNIENNITLVTARVNQAAIAAGRSPDEILLLAVSKTRSAEDIRSAINAGIREFGENYLQEAVEKIAQLAAENVQWHFIGPIQSNKTRLVEVIFDPPLHDEPSMALAHTGEAGRCPRHSGY